ncbi:alpha/beta fold hydrolase [Cellulomonas sp. HZM]|uniref:alpha/beta fold hydrolase n=1 Tax=Cellulomonas sp. HZM TaxID=1454010 RepID=UPI00054D4A1F|nr:alpha/beta hydrolase [Cellulomonas sp. HZM]
MHHVQLGDGSTLAVEDVGSGHPVLLLPGAMNDRGRLLPLAHALAAVGLRGVAVDRRGRGDSTDATPGLDGAVEREVDDVRSLVADLAADAPDGVAVLGFSSGGVLALAAAAAGVSVSHVVALEAPFAVEGAPPRDARAGGDLAALVDAHRDGDAIELYQTRVIGLPSHAVAGQRDQPWWPALEALAPSLLYDWAITTRYARVDDVAAVSAPTLVVRSDDTWPVLVASAEALVAALPDAELATVPGRDHAPDPTATAAAVAAFVAHAGS